MTIIIGVSAIVALAALASGLLLDSTALIVVGVVALIAFCLFGSIGKAKSRR